MFSKTTQQKTKRIKNTGRTTIPQHQKDILFHDFFTHFPTDKIQLIPSHRIPYFYLSLQRLPK